MRKDIVYLSGIGGNDIQCATQIQSEVKIDDHLISLLFHVVPNCNISDPIIIGRDIFDLGLCVKTDNDNLVIYTKEQSQFCNKTLDTSNLNHIFQFQLSRHRFARAR